MTPLLSVRNLRKSYGALKVTDDVSLDVAPGELHAIIGPNGAGKTTLIHQLSGSLPSDSGTVHLAGEDVTALPMVARVRRGLARSFQITSILDGFSVLENVALAVQARSGSSFRFFRPRRERDPAQRRGDGCARPRRPRRPGRGGGPAACRMARSASSNWRWRSRRRPACCSSTSRSPAPARRNRRSWSG